MQATLIAIIFAAAGDGDRVTLEYAPAAVENPLKGLVPYQGDSRSRFPHSMEFNYLPYSALVKGYEEFDWAALESLLVDVSSRGHQAVFRVYLEYPGKKDVIPGFLIADGLKVSDWATKESRESAAVQMETPNYEDAALRRSLKSFISALGRKYDSDPRIGFITAGLLGTWGEWHCYPRDDLFASKAVQAEVMDAYEAAFRVTPVLLRYPTGPSSPTMVPNADRAFGYHDDSFAWATLDTGRPQDDWFFVPTLKEAGLGAVEKWKAKPIGGEIRPEAWGTVFDKSPSNPQIQDLRLCIEQTHASWLMDSGLFSGAPDPERNKRAETHVRRMGYEFHIPAVTIEPAAGGKASVAVEVENRGVAPFYYDWKPRYGLIAQRAVVKSLPGSGTLTGILPGESPRVWNETLDLSDVKPGTYRLAISVPNPLKNGHPLKFANTSQDADADGWVTLGTLRVP